MLQFITLGISLKYVRTAQKTWWALFFAVSISCLWKMIDTSQIPSQVYSMISITSIHISQQRPKSNSNLSPSSLPDLWWWHSLGGWRRNYCISPCPTHNRSFPYQRTNKQPNTIANPQNTTVLVNPQIKNTDLFRNPTNPWMFQKFISWF